MCFFFLNCCHFRTPPSGIAYDKASAATAGFPDKSFNESCRCCASFDLPVVMERKQLSFWSKMMRTSPCENDQETSTEGFMMIYDDQATGIFTRGKVIGGWISADESVANLDLHWATWGKLVKVAESLSLALFVSIQPTWHADPNIFWWHANASESNQWCRWESYVSQLTVQFMLG